MLRQLKYYIFLLPVFAFGLGPLILLFTNSLKSEKEFHVDPFALPADPQWKNLVRAWELGEYGRAFINSAIVGILTIIIILVAAALAAYALSKCKFKYTEIIIGMLLFVMAVPSSFYLVPLFYAWKKVNLLDTLPGLILIYSAKYLPFNILFLRSFFIKIPDDLIESARIDGCSEIQLLTRIILPICRPVVLTLILIAGLWTWKEFFFANAFLHSNEVQTVSIRYLAFTSEYMSDWPMIFSAGVITLLPFILLYLVLQRQFIEGLTAGSLVG